MSTIVNLVRHGFFLDSIALMRISQNIGELPGIEDAALMMGTPSNKQIMRDADLLKEDGEAAVGGCLLYTSPSPRDLSTSRMPSSA